MVSSSVEMEMEMEMEMETSMHQKLQVLRFLTKSKSFTRSSIIVDAVNYINDLKLKIDLLNKQCTIPTTDVKVEKVEKGYQVRVICEKARDNVLVSVIEVLEDKGLNVLHVNISCIPSFSMEAIIETPPESQLDVGDLTQAIYSALKTDDVES